jgi:hypothetical protein
MQIMSLPATGRLIILNYKNEFIVIDIIAFDYCGSCFADAK